MNLNPFFKSVIDQDCAPVVICDLEHTVLYMNPTAIKRYAKYGGEELVGKSLLRCHSERSRQQIKQVLAWFAKSPDNNIVYESRNEAENKDIYMVALRDESEKLIGYYEKHECRQQESAPFYDF